MGWVHHAAVWHGGVHALWIAAGLGDAKVENQRTTVIIPVEYELRFQCSGVQAFLQGGQDGFGGFHFTVHCVQSIDRQDTASSMGKRMPLDVLQVDIQLRIN